MIRLPTERIATLAFTSERLSYRPLAMDDLDLALALFTDETVTRYVCDVHTPAQVEQSMADSVRRGGDGCIGIWCVRRLDTGEKIGSAVILPLPVDTDDTDWRLVRPGHWPEEDLEIGYLLRPSAWGSDEVVAVTDPANHASQRVLHKIGMREEGTRRAYATQCSAFRLDRDGWWSRQRD